MSALDYMTKCMETRQQLLGEHLSAAAADDAPVETERKQQLAADQFKLLTYQAEVVRPADVTSIDGSLLQYLNIMSYYVPVHTCIKVMRYAYAHECIDTSLFQAAVEHDYSRALTHIRLAKDILPNMKNDVR